MAITVGIIEDHSEFRQSLGYLVSSTPDMEVAWSFSSVEEALREFNPPDVMLLDINLPGISGVDAIPLFKEKDETIKIVILTISEEDQHIFTAIRNGADGYILKKSNRNKILEAIFQVHEGEAALTPMVARQVMAFLKAEPSKAESPSVLTNREKEILTLITQGMINDMIAEKLFISPQTVHNHIRNIYDKLQVHSRAQVVSKALKERLV
jgi:DNA-binding NarL/FixJ family response regulator